MRTVLANLGCFILFVLFLPLFLIFIGPLLVLAAWRGRQPVGPIMLNTLRYGLFGRIGAFMLGLAIWLLVWSGLAWVVVNGLFSASTVANVDPLPPPTLLTEHAVPSQSQLEAEDNIAAEQNGVSSPTSTMTPTPLSPTATPTSTSTPTVLVVIDPTPTLNSTPSLTITPLVNTLEYTVEPTPDQPVSLNEAAIDESDVVTAPFSLADQQDVIATVKESNSLLREAISLANQENVQKLEKIWQGRALDKAQNFVSDLYGRYVKPFDVEFEYITLPTVSSQSTLNQAIVVSQEAWIYQGRSGTHREAFEFTYTLNRENGRWVITQYSYRNLTPTLAPTATPSDAVQ